MTSISIGGNTRTIDEATRSWVAQQIRDRRADGRPTCVQVSVDEPAARVALASGACARGRGGGRPPNALESAIIDLWRRRGLADDEINPGEVIAFLVQLDGLIS